MNDADAGFCVECRTPLFQASQGEQVQSWRRRARVRRRLTRAVIAATILFLAGWIVVENIGLARFLPAPASDLTSPVSADAWPTAHGGPSRDGVAAWTGSLSGALQWTVDLGASPAGSPVIAGGTVYVGTTDGQVHARALADGSSIWTRDVGAPVSSPLALAGDLVFVGLQDGRLTALESDTGASVWEFETGQRVRSSPAVVEGVLYVGSGDRRLYAIDALTGEERWSFATDGRITTAPSVNDSLVIVTSQDNFVHFIDHHTAKRRFDYKISLTEGSAALAGDSVYVADISGSVRRIHWDERVWPFEKAVRAVRRWMFRWGMASELPPQKGVVWVTQDRRESFVGTPSVDAHSVYVSTASGTLIAFGRASGDERWRADVAQTSLTSATVVGDHVLVGDRAGSVTAVLVDTGEVDWRLDVQTSVSEGIAVAAGVAVVVTDAGVLNTIR